MVFIMSKESKELVQLINKYQRGVDESFDRLCDRIEPKVYTLVSMVYDKEENRDKLVRHIFSKLKKAAEEVLVNSDDVELWLAQFCTKIIFNIYSQGKNVLSEETDTINQEEYEFNSIGYDDELKNCVQYYNKAIDSNDLDALDSIANLSKTQILIYQLYCYAEYTVDELEELFDADSMYIENEIIALKNILLDEYAQIEADGKAGASESDDLQNKDDSDMISRIYSALPERTMIIIGSGIAALIIILAVVTVSLIGKTGKSSGDTPSESAMVSQTTTAYSEDDELRTGQWINNNTTPAALKDSPTIKPNDSKNETEENMVTTTAAGETENEATSSSAKPTQPETNNATTGAATTATTAATTAAPADKGDNTKGTTVTETTSKN